MIDTSALRFRIEPMRASDVDAVMEIEYASFSTPWSARAYNYELHHNQNSCYFVARPVSVIPSVPSSIPVWQRLFPFLFSGSLRSPKPIVGYGGFQLVVDEAHISTIAVHPEWRQCGIGELLLIAMIDRAVELKAAMATLEVRASNIAAQALYRKYGFEVVGTRKRYYQDDGEDGYIMTASSIQSDAYRARLREFSAALWAGLAR